MGTAARLRTFALPLAALAVTLAGEAGGRALKGPGLDACLAQPSAPCLLDLAVAERDAFHRGSAKDEAFNRDRWLQLMASAEMQANRLLQASSYLAQVPPVELHDMFVDIDGEFEPMPEGLDAQGLIAQALEANTTAALRADETVWKSLDRRAEAAWLLLAFDQRSKADAALRSTMSDFVSRLKAGDKEVIVAASTLMKALITLGDPALVEQLAGVLTDTSAGTGDQAEFVEGERLRALRDLRLARIRSQMASNPASVAPEPGDDDYVMGKVALAWALSGDTTRTVDLLRSASQPSQELVFLVWGLLKRDQFDTAIALADQAQSDEDRSWLLSDISTDLAAKGGFEQAEALLDRITVPRHQSDLLIKMAQRRADTGNIESARDLLAKGMAALVQEKEPMSRLMLSFDAAWVQITLGDRVAARQSVEAGLVVLRRVRGETEGDISEPMDGFVIAVRAAAVLAELGDGNGALDPFSMVTPQGYDEDKVMGAILVAHELVQRNRADLARALLLTTLRDSVARPSIDHDDWSGLFPLMAVAWLATEEAKGGTGGGGDGAQQPARRRIPVMLRSHGKGVSAPHPIATITYRSHRAQ